MFQIARKWTSAGLGLLTLTAFVGCQSAGSRSLSVKKPDATIDQPADKADSSERPSHRLAEATEPAGGTSIEGMPGRVDRPATRRARFRPTSRRC